MSTIIIDELDIDIVIKNIWFFINKIQVNLIRLEKDINANSTGLNNVYAEFFHIKSLLEEKDLSSKIIMQEKRLQKVREEIDNQNKLLSLLREEENILTLKFDDLTLPSMEFYSYKDLGNGHSVIVSYFKTNAALTDKVACLLTLKYSPGSDRFGCSIKEFIKCLRKAGYYAEEIPKLPSGIEFKCINAVTGNY